MNDAEYLMKNYGEQMSPFELSSCRSCHVFSYFFD